HATRPALPAADGGDVHRPLPLGVGSRPAPPPRHGQPARGVAGVGGRREFAGSRARAAGVMSGAPRITIAVPSFNQGRFIRETLDSLVAQDYPNLEVIVQDGGSTDGAAEIAREFADRFPGVFRVHVERDRGHAHALNIAFRKSTGDILGYLNTDDTLYPGCLARVAREIDPARGRYIVFGRCLFTGEGSPYVGREHPAEFHGHFDMLAVWRRGYSILPQPSPFRHLQ